MLIDAKGNKVGVLPLSDALESAQLASLDLVHVSPSDADPVVCIFLDYGNLLFVKNKIQSASRVKTKKYYKEIKFRPSTIQLTIILNLKKLKALFLMEIRLK